MTTTEEFVQQYNEKSKGLSLPNILKAFEYFSIGELVECDNVFDNVKVKIQIEDSVENYRNEFKIAGKTPINDSKKPIFEWTDELAAKCSREIWMEKEESKIWTGDLRAEQMAVARFKRNHIINERLKDIVILQKEGEVTVKSEGLNKLFIDLISNSNFD